MLFLVSHKSSRDNVDKGKLFFTGPFTGYTQTPIVLDPDVSKMEEIIPDFNCHYTLIEQMVNGFIFITEPTLWWYDNVPFQ
jgi:hypothetical protein